MREVVLALDPGVTTGWAVVRRRDHAILGLGDLAPEDVGTGVDLLVRSMHRLEYIVRPVVEQMPDPKGLPGRLGTELEFVRRMIDHQLIDVFELNVYYVAPGVWKNSASAHVITPPAAWNGKTPSPHMRDAYGMAMFYSRRRP